MNAWLYLVVSYSFSFLSFFLVYFKWKPTAFVGHFCSLLFWGLTWLQVEAAPQLLSLSAGKTLWEMPMRRPGFPMRPKFFIVYLSSKGASFLLVNMYSHCQDKHIWAHVRSLWWPVIEGGCCWWWSAMVLYLFQITLSLLKSSQGRRLAT